MISEGLTGRLREDPILFAEKILSFHATEYQKRVLRDESKRVAIRIARQSGKSLSIRHEKFIKGTGNPFTLIYSKR